MEMLFDKNEIEHIGEKEVGQDTNKFLVKGKKKKREKGEKKEKKKKEKV